MHDDERRTFNNGKGGDNAEEKLLSLFFNFKTLNLNTLNESHVNNAFFFFPFFGSCFLCPSDDDLFIILSFLETKRI